MTVEQLATEAFALPSELRTRLVEQLVESLDESRVSEVRVGFVEARSGRVPPADPETSRSFLQTARSLKLDGPVDWSEKLDEYLYGDKAAS
jgi:hypothetical protein